MTDDFDKQGQNMVNDMYEKGGKAVGKGANKLARKATKGIKKAGKKALKQVGKAVAKAIVKIVQILIKIIIAILPYLLIVIAVVIVCFFIWDLVFNSRGKTEMYQTESVDELNAVAKQDDGSISATELSQGNKIVKAFYTYFSERSLWVTVEKQDGTKIIKEPLQYNSKRFIELYGEDGNGSASNGEKLKDKYGRESMFFLNPNALYVLDEFLNEGKFRFPEQFVKPVYYDKDTYELLSLTEENGESEKLVAKSTEYEKDGDGKYVAKTDGSTTTGLWDYGFGSIANYVQYDEEYENRGTYTTVILWNVTKGEYTGEIPIDDAKTLIENSNNNPHKDDPSYSEKHEDYATYGDVYILDIDQIPDSYTRHVRTDLVYMINRVTTPAGFINQDIYCEWEPTNETFKESTSFSNKIKRRESYEEPVKKYDYENITVDTDIPQLKQVYIDNITGADTFEEKDSEGNPNAIKTETKWKFVEETVNIEAYAEGNLYAKIPRYQGNPDTSSITGNEYFIDYMKHYSTYVPDEAITSFDFKKRTDMDDEELLAILEKEQYQSGDNTGSTINIDHFELGSGASSDSYLQAMQYFDIVQRIAQKYGLDPYLVICVICQESSGRIDAQNGPYGFGLMQLEMSVYNGKAMTVTRMDGSTQTYNISYDLLRDNAEVQIDIGCHMLRAVGAKYGYRAINALQAYNTGEGGFQTIVAKYTSDKYNIPYQEVMYDYQSETLKAKTQEVIKSGDLGWLEYRQWYADSGYKVYGSVGGGNPRGLEMVLQYYTSVDGETPWMIDDNGNKISMDGSFETGTASGVSSISSASSSTDSWIVKGWATIKKGWHTLFPEAEPTMDSKCEPFKNKQNTPDAETLIKMMFVMEEKKYLTDYDRFTTEDWKSMYEKLFSNPIGGKWSGKQSGTVNVTDWFKDGFVTPLDLSPLTIQNPYDPPSHYGVDIVAPKGTTVRAVADGTVTEVNNDSNSSIGRYITITHDNGVQTVYGNLASINVKKGDKVSKGDKIGTTGNEKEGSVLHFELIKENTKSDPTWMITGSFSAEDYNMTEADYQTISQVISLAKQQIGKPYVWGNRGPNSFDCSGLMQWLYLQITGIDIGANTYAQSARLVNYSVDINNLQPGDILMPSDEHHVVLYIGNGRIIHAANEQLGVREDPVGTSYTKAFRPIGYINSVK